MTSSFSLKRGSTKETKTDTILIPNFQPPFRCDRIGRVGGGVAIYVKDTLYAKERSDLSIINLEAIWIELHTNQRKLLIGGIYRPPDSNNNHWTLLQESIDRAFNQVCDNILVTGDFNINVHNSTSNKISRLISSYNAEQLISTPTHYTEHSNSLIDLMFVKHTNQVITSFVADPFIPDLIRFHCPIVTVMKFNKPKTSTYKRRIWLYDRGDFDNYRNIINTTNWDNLLQSDDLNSIATSISDTIIDAATKTIPNKIATISQMTSPGLTPIYAN